jgi:hypothetical protein
VPDPAETALAFDKACRGARVPYALLGGMAVNAWGQPRATMDVDAMVVLAEPQAEGFVAALHAAGLAASAHDFHAAFRDPAHVTVFDDRTGFHVDVKLARTAAEREQVADAVAIPFRDGALVVARPEDTIAFKLRFGSPQDLADARSILVRQAGKLDENRLQAWALRLDVVAALRAVRREATGGHP